LQLQLVGLQLQLLIFRSKNQTQLDLKTLPVPAVCFVILVHHLMVLGLPHCHVVGLPWPVSLHWSSLLSLVFVSIAVAGVIWVDGIVVVVGGLLLQLPFGSWVVVLVVVVVVVVV
jgi:hypothetical protein